jgi:hypothetical protein
MEESLRKKREIPMKDKENNDCYHDTPTSCERQKPLQQICAFDV